MALIKAYTLSELTQGLEVTIRGDANCLISGICPIQQSKPAHITFLTNSLYRKHLATLQAAAVILTEKDAALCPTHVNAVISNNPHYVYSKIAAFFDPLLLTRKNGIHPSAVIAKEASIHETASIGPHCVIGQAVKIAANVVIKAGTIVEDFAEIGEETCLDANVTIYHHVKIGKRVRIASGAVIGSEGFGFANQKGVWHKVPQLGSVEIGDEVDIGANTTIDRGAVDNTILEAGVKLDNLIQIGHNVKIGANTIIAGCVGIAGSAVIGKNCMIGGAASISGHLTIADNVMITGGAGVTKSIPEPGLYSSGIAGIVTNLEFRKNNARFHRLEHLMQKVKALESILHKMTEKNET